MNRVDIEDILCSAQLPKYVLFQNLTFAKAGPDPEPWDRIDSCDWLKMSDSIDELTIPGPPLKNPEMFIQIIEKYGESVPAELKARSPRDYTQHDIDYLRQLAQEYAEFDTTILELCEWDRHTASDKELYGVRFTLLFLCPVNPQTIADRLMAEVAKRLERRKDQRVGGDMLAWVWEDCVDRMWIYPASDDADDILHEARDMFYKKLASLPNAPTKQDWDFLQEHLMQ